MNNNYANACTEVSEILKYIPQEYLDKIPLHILKNLEENKDTNYNFYYNIDKSYEEQGLLDETKAILANIYIDYWATQEEKEIIKKIHDEDKAKIELLKQQKYDPNDLFKNKKRQNQNSIESTQLIEVSKETFIKKIINSIKRFLGF